MLINFKFSNFRSFKEETNLDMEASRVTNYQDSLIKYEKMDILPAVAIFGKNGAGKSNVIRAFWLAVEFIKNAQRTQHEKATIPLTPFLLNDYSKDEPTIFEFTYVIGEIKYIYGFGANSTSILTEYLYHYPKGKKASIFTRENQEFKFTDNGDKQLKKLISVAVAKNQLFFSVACTMNYTPCITAMKWFREQVTFSRDFTDIPKQLIEYSENKDILNSIVEYARQADVGIEDMTFEFKNEELSSEQDASNDMSEEVKTALTSFLDVLSSPSNIAETGIIKQEIKTQSYHSGIAKSGEQTSYALELSDESDGTRKLMALAPTIERALKLGGVFLIDEIEKEMHPILVEYIVAKFQSKNTNSTKAQLIFTTHSTELLELEILRKDQIYLTDKDNLTGESDLYNLTEFSLAENTNVRKGYLMGKYGATPNIDIEEIE